MKRAYKYKFYPTDEQAMLLAKSFGCARFLYNNTLRYRTDKYYKEGVSIGSGEASARIIPLKKEFQWLKEVSSVLLQQCLRNQEQAFNSFYAGRTKYPTFKRKDARQSIRLLKAPFYSRKANYILPSLMNRSA
jgi:putative transposase